MAARRHRFLLVLLTLAVAAPAAVAAPGPRDEREPLTAAGNRLARQTVLRPSDLGAGWQSQRLPQSDDGAARCPGYDPDLSRFTIVGKAQSAFTNGAGGQVMSSTEVFATAAQAADDFRTGVQPALAACLRHMLERQFRAARIDARVASSRPVAAPRVGDRAAAFRVVTALGVEGRSLRLYTDLLVFQRGRSISALSFTGALRPLERRDAFAHLVAARMR